MLQLRVFKTYKACNQSITLYSEWINCDTILIKYLDGFMAILINNWQNDYNIEYRTI